MRLYLLNTNLVIQMLWNYKACAYNSYVCKSLAAKVDRINLFLCLESRTLYFYGCSVITSWFRLWNFWRRDVEQEQPYSYVDNKIHFLIASGIEMNLYFRMPYFVKTGQSWNCSVSSFQNASRYPKCIISSCTDYLYVSRKTAI